MKTKTHKNSFFLKTKNCQLKTTHGFTIIELLVAGALFSSAVVIGVGSVFAVLNANSKAQSVQLVMNNINFVFENMVRHIRTGSVYHCRDTGMLTNPRDCPTGADSFVFESEDGDRADSDDQWIYRYNAATESIEKSQDSGDTFASLTAPEVHIESLRFYVEGAPAMDTAQPMVIIVVQGYAEVDARTTTAFNLQTTVSQRIPDF